MKVCPWCAEELGHEARVCSQCGHDPNERPSSSLNVAIFAPASERASAGAPGPPAPGIPRAPGIPPTPGIPPVGTRERETTDGLAVASVVLAVAAIVPRFLVPGFLAFAMDVLAVVLGVLALRRVQRTHERGRELAWVGVILGAVGLSGYVYVLLLAPRVLLH